MHCLHGKEDFELRKKRRDGHLAAISREDIDTFALHKYRICSRHFILDGPADLYDQTNPAWLSTLNLGPEKHGDNTLATPTSVAVERWKRATEREKWKQNDELLPTVYVVTNEIDFIINKELE